MLEFQYQPIKLIFSKPLDWKALIKFLESNYFHDSLTAVNSWYTISLFLIELGTARPRLFTEFLCYIFLIDLTVFFCIGYYCISLENNSCNFICLLLYFTGYISYIISKTYLILRPKVSLVIFRPGKLYTKVSRIRHKGYTSVLT